MECLSDNDIAALVGSEASAKRSELLAHVETCEACRVVVAAAMPSGETSLEIGARLGRFVILERLGEGGMGVVYAAHDLELRRRVALKMVRSVRTDDDGSARLMREARAIARLQHRNVLSIYDVGVDPRGVFIAMELIEGTTLRQWTRDRERGWQAIVGVYVQAGRGLNAAHEKSIIHRDFKPENVLIEDSGRVVVADFGLARADTGVFTDTVPANATLPRQDEAETRAGAVMGTQGFIAPEVLAGEPATARSDQYAFCVSLCESLTGKRFVVDPVPNGPGWLKRAIARGTADDPKDRYPSMAALLDDIDVRKRFRRRRRVTAGALALAACGGALLIGTYAGGDTASASPCEPVRAALLDAWNDDRKNAIRSRLVDSGLATETEWQLASGRIDMIVARLDSRLSECTDSDASSRVLGCLHRRTIEIDALAEMWRDGDREVGRAIAQTSLELDDRGSCAPKRDPLAPSSPEMMEALAQIKLAYVGTQSAKLESLASSALAKARSQNDRRAEAEIIFYRNRVEVGAPNHETASAFERVFELATVEGDDELAVLGAIYQIRASADADDERWRWLVDRAELALRRAGDPQQLRATYHYVRGGAERYRGNTEASDFHYGRAVAIREETLGPTHWRTMSAKRSQAIGAARRGALSEAVSVNEEALRVFSAELGANSRRLVGVLSALSSGYWWMGDIDSSAKAGKRFREVSERHFVEGHPMRAHGRVLAALARAERDDRDGALKLLASEDDKPTGPTTLLFAKGRLWTALGEDKKALRVFDAIVARVPGRPTAIAGRAEVRWRLGDADGALVDAARALEVVDRSSGAPVGLLAARMLFVQALAQARRNELSAADRLGKQALERLDGHNYNRADEQRQAINRCLEKRWNGCDAPLM